MLCIYGITIEIANVACK